MSEELKQQRNTTTGLAKHRRIADTFSASRKKEEEDTKLCWGKSRPAGGGWARGRPFSCLWCSIRRPAAVPSFMVFRSLDPHQLLLFQTFFGQTLQKFVIIHIDAAAKMTCRPSSTLESGSESCAGSGLFRSKKPSTRSTASSQSGGRRARSSPPPCLHSTLN
jgi:hypothetical protein